MGLFNRVRPQYPITKYSEVFGYNSGMEKFRREIITNDEINAIENWTDDSYDIKAVMWGIKKNAHASIQAKILFNLFNKYDTNIEQNIPMYRGISMDKETWETYEYESLKKGDLYSPDEDAIVSFSKNKRVAYDFAYEYTGEYKIIIKVMSNQGKALDISSMSTLTSEEETIITKNLWYNVERIKRRGKWMLIILGQLEEE